MKEIFGSDYFLVFIVLQELLILILWLFLASAQILGKEAIFMFQVLLASLIARHIPNTISSYKIFWLRPFMFSHHYLMSYFNYQHCHFQNMGNHFLFVCLSYGFAEGAESFLTHNWTLFWQISLITEFGLQTYFRIYYKLLWNTN